MLRPLQSALAEWSPRTRTVAEPLAAVAAAWPAIVGRDVAEHTRPAAVNGDSLLVVTQSSSWSQQLALLSAEIVSGLQTLPETAHVARLRFRVGSMRRARRSAPPATAQPRRARPAPLAEPATDAADALRRFRERVARKRRGARAACSTCGAGHEGGGVCAPCGEAALRTRKLAVQRLLYEAPWLGFAEISRLVGGVERTEYDVWRRALLARWWEILLRAGWAKRAGTLERRVASSYVLLQSGLAPDRISPAVVRNLLGADLAALLYEQRG